jgi:hypothetical protein
LTPPQVKLDSHNIEEIVFNLNGQLLFISTGETGFVCSVSDGTVQARSDLVNGSNRKWLCHPTQPNILLGYGALDVQAYDWKQLSLLCVSSYHELQHRPGLGSRINTASELESEDFSRLSLTNSAPSALAVANVILTQDAKHILLHVKTDSGSTGVSKPLMVISTTALEPTDTTNCLPPSLGFQPIPPHIAAQVSIPLGVLPGFKLAFLDHDLWLCTYSLGAGFQNDGADAYNRFYFIPRDWMGRCSQDGIVLKEDGTLFWPRDDRVVLIECNLDDPKLPSLFHP